MRIKNIYTNIDDSELLHLLKRGNKLAFTTLYMQYHKMLYVVAFRYLQSQEMAEDAVQHVYTILWQQHSELTEITNVRNYLYTMLKNHVLNQIRNNNSAIAKNYEIAQSAPAYEDNIIEMIEHKEFMSIFRKAVEMLSEPKKTICLMKMRDGMSNKEIADKIGISINTVKTHYSQIIKILRANIGKLITIICTIITRF